MRLAERANDRLESFRALVEGALLDTWTALPGRVVSFNPASSTISVQPAYQATRRLPEGGTAPLDLPVLVDVPVVFPGGGGATLTFPIAPGDECLLVFCSRSIDGWFQTGQATPEADVRNHDLSDAIALVGVRSGARALPAVSVNSTQLRSDDGAMSVDFNVTSGEVTFTCARLICTGEIVSQEEVRVGDIRLTTHKHAGVTAGAANSGGPIP